MEKFSRRTNGGRFIPEIDGLRFIAIALVVVYHAEIYTRVKLGTAPSNALGQLVARLTAHGGFGVAFFFVISGFILGLPFAKHHLHGSSPVRLKPYFLRRLTRLEPPYILSLIFCYLGIVLLKSGGPVELRHLVASIFYLHNPIYGPEGVVNPVAWSLEVEVQFYLLVPLLARVYAIRQTWLRRSVFAWLAVTVPCLQLFPFADPAWVGGSIVNYLQYFIAGLVLADIYTVDWREAPRAHPVWDVVWIAGWCFLGALTEHTPLAKLSYPVVTFVLYIAAFRGTVVRTILRSPLLTAIGGMCYTIYLLHYPLISIVGRVTARLAVRGAYLTTLAVQLPIYVGAILFVSALYFRAIEQPCMRSDWPSRLKDRILAMFGLGPESSSSRAVPPDLG
ncbi:acyltransferase family protein [Pendulispora albinea]|uniref:Acyltransferase n=1 Tax=Pendulispora albinea TaxID=2741071 RepID=A0ABZ2LL87_9BACT